MLGSTTPSPLIPPPLLALLGKMAPTLLKGDEENDDERSYSSFIMSCKGPCLLNRYSQTNLTEGTLLIAIYYIIRMDLINLG